jgi:hypothetical protein
MPGQLHPEQLGPFVDLIALHFRRKRFVFEFLANAFLHRTDFNSF